MALGCLHEQRCSACGAAQRPLQHVLEPRARLAARREFVLQLRLRHVLERHLAAGVDARINSSARLLVVQFAPTEQSAFRLPFACFGEFS